ncbi:hypothetical protein LOC68_07080 [Blastopirellula sp. JC732]|uniref:Uncharacterized protein n=1 Tax=Blastopirellula sediminis TaxID=2894196 RepID=A0A9X1SFC5_9BACT|nr:hypothetical protein [Blastopirellula sediminis]MCC9609070.1 hypothetical protein [Blastopirellula sediminis]MCC9628153.1 hypothetical protein [Blastopirellula sediminis]
MTRSTILLFDAIISLALGVFLAAFPRALVELLGLPATETVFYPSLLGGVVIGIAIALFYEWKLAASGRSGAGLGVRGAMAIDLSAAAFLAGWLICGDLELPMRGVVILWGIVGLLILVSVLGFLAEQNLPRE